MTDQQLLLLDTGAGFRATDPASSRRAAAGQDRSGQGDTEKEK